MLKHLKFYKYAAAWLVLITVLSLLPAQNFENKKMDGLDLVIHFVFYAILFWLIATANIRLKQQKCTVLYPVYKAIGFAVSYGIFIELLQGTVFATRSMSVADILANTTGIACSAALYRLVYGAPKNYY